MKILVDNQLPAALARFLAARVHDSQHVLDLGMEEASDVEIWEYASRHQCVVITKDADFLHVVNTRPSDACLVWVRFGNCRTPVLLTAIDRLWPRIEAALSRGEKIVEVR